MAVDYSKYDRGSRRTVINWNQHLSSIRDGYEQFRGIPHGVQKDAIQNAWDARKHDSGKNWEMRFVLFEGPEKNYLEMKDSGTVGLTGRVLDPEEYLEDLRKEERWGRFESLAFTKDDSEETLGSRGRGKFIFVVASQDRVIVYDSLREDGTYRAGMRRVEKTSSPVNAWDGEEGKAAFRDLTGNELEPLEEVGTRVVIVNPEEELTKAIESELYKRFIGETWWEIIQKKDAKIIVENERVGVPPEFDLIEEDTGEKRCWIKQNIELDDNLRVKNLHLVYTNKDVPEDIKGVAFQRGGMKVDTLEPRYLPRDIAENIYGYVELDRQHTPRLRRAENVEHYDFNYRYKEPREVRDFVQNECENFAEEKLGWQRDRRQVQALRQRDAERKALNEINRISSDFNFHIDSTPGPGPSSGGTGRVQSSKDRGPTKLIRVQMPDLALPRSDDRRVNFGESVGNIIAGVINESSVSVQTQFKLYIRKGDDLLNTFHNEDYTLHPEEQVDKKGPEEIEMSEEVYEEPGKYTIVSRLTSKADFFLKNGDEFTRGDIIDEKKRSFYLEVEPPSGGGIFEDCEAIGFPEDFHKMGRIRTGEEGGLSLQYNTNHPNFEKVYDDEEELAEYLFRIMTLELCSFDLEQPQPAMFEETDLDYPGEIAKKISDLVGDFSYRYFQER